MWDKLLQLQQDKTTQPRSIYIYVSGMNPHPNSKQPQSISWPKAKCEMNTNPRSSITRPVPRSPSLTFRISKRSARTIVSKLNPLSLPFLIFSEAYTFPRRVRSRIWPGVWKRALFFLQQIGGLSKKSGKFLARTRPLCALKRHHSLLQIKEFFKPSHWHLLRVCLRWLSDIFHRLRVWQKLLC